MKIERIHTQYQTKSGTKKYSVEFDSYILKLIKIFINVKNYSTVYYDKR